MSDRAETNARLIAPNDVPEQITLVWRRCLTAEEFGVISNHPDSDEARALYAEAESVVSEIMTESMIAPAQPSIQFVWGGKWKFPMTQGLAIESVSRPDLIYMMYWALGITDFRGHA